MDGKFRQYAYISCTQSALFTFAYNVEVVWSYRAIVAVMMATMALINLDGSAFTYNSVAPYRKCLP